MIGPVANDARTSWAERGFFLALLVICLLPLAVLCRHGQSTWNLENLFTGWKDVDLTEKGITEAQQAGKDLQELGIELDAENNAAARGETKINSADSHTEIWVIPTNEEIVVARQAKELLSC